MRMSHTTIPPPFDMIWEDKKQNKQENKPEKHTEQKLTPTATTDSALHCLRGKEADRDGFGCGLRRGGPFIANRANVAKPRTDQTIQVERRHIVLDAVRTEGACESNGDNRCTANDNISTTSCPPTDTHATDTQTHRHTDKDTDTDTDTHTHTHWTKDGSRASQRVGSHARCLVEPERVVAHHHIATTR